MESENRIKHKSQTQHLTWYRRASNMGEIEKRFG